MNEIKQCPFCASKDTEVRKFVAQEGSPGKHFEHAVMCLNCGAYGPNDLGESGAIEAWNMRRKTFPGEPEPEPRRMFQMVELKEGVPVQYLGVYVTRWESEWGLPQYGFVEAPHETP